VDLSDADPHPQKYQKANPRQGHAFYRVRCCILFLHFKVRPNSSSAPPLLAKFARHCLSIIRLYTIRVFTDSKDPFYDGVPINVWSMVEINIAIICASVPGERPPWMSSPIH